MRLGFDEERPGRWDGWRAETGPAHLTPRNEEDPLCGTEIVLVGNLGPVRRMDGREGWIDCGRGPQAACPDCLLRAHVVRNPQPYLPRLPSIFQEVSDDTEFTHDFVSAFDDVMTPVHVTLDNVLAYFDPDLAPEDFVAWMATWFGEDFGAAPENGARTFLAGALGRVRRRGTLPGLREVVEAVAGDGSTVDIEESGGTIASATPNAALPGSPDPFVRVIVTAPETATVDVERVQETVAQSKPAHLPHTVEVRPAAAGRGQPAEGAGDARETTDG